MYAQLTSQPSSTQLQSSYPVRRHSDSNNTTCQCCPASTHSVTSHNVTPYRFCRDRCHSDHSRTYSDHSGYPDHGGLHPPPYESVQLHDMSRTEQTTNKNFLYPPTQCPKQHLKEFYNDDDDEVRDCKSILFNDEFGSKSCMNVYEDILVGAYFGEGYT